MGKGLSVIQNAIIEVLKENNGCKWYELTALAKKKLYPSLYRPTPNDQPAYIWQIHGEKTKEKNKARATISRSIKRLKDRNLITEDEKWNYYYNG
jgi:hypothetical protein